MEYIQHCSVADAVAINKQNRVKSIASKTIKGSPEINKESSWQATPRHPLVPPDTTTTFSVGIATQNA